MLNRQLIILCIILFGLGVISQPVQYLFPKYVEDTLGSRLWLAGILMIYGFTFGIGNLI